MQEPTEQHTLGSTQRRVAGMTTGSIQTQSLGIAGNVYFGRHSTVCLRLPELQESPQQQRVAAGEFFSGSGHHHHLLGLLSGEISSGIASLTSFETAGTIFLWSPQSDRLGVPEHCIWGRVIVWDCRNIASGVVGTSSFAPPERHHRLGSHQLEMLVLYQHHTYLGGGQRRGSWFKFLTNKLIVEIVFIFEV